MTLNLTMLRSSNKVCTLYIQTSQIYFYPTGSRPRYCSVDSHCSSGESCGNDQTIHADGNQYSAEEGHFRGCRLLWFPFPFLSTDLGWHTHCLSGDGCLHLHSCQVGHESKFFKVIIMINLIMIDLSSWGFWGYICIPSGSGLLWVLSH